MPFKNGYHCISHAFTNSQGNLVIPGDVKVTKEMIIVAEPHDYKIIKSSAFIDDDI